jgi:hypothetical protein
LQVTFLKTIRGKYYGKQYSDKQRNWFGRSNSSYDKLEHKQEYIMVHISWNLFVVLCALLRNDKLKGETMFTKIKAFFTAKIFLTRGQVITQGMLYQLEKENDTLTARVGGLKASFTKQDKKCALCRHHPENKKDSIGE